MKGARGARILAGSLATIGIALGLAAVPLFIIDRAVPTSVFAVRGFPAGFAVAFAVVGWLVATRRPRNPIGWCFLAANVLSGLQVFGYEYAIFSIARHGGSLPLTTLLGWLQSFLWVFSVSLVVIATALLFPDGTLPSKRWRPVAFMIMVGIAVFSVASATVPGQVTSAPIGFTNPYAASKAMGQLLQGIGGTLFMASLLAATIAIVTRFRKSVGDEHEQMKWLAYATSMVVLVLIPDLVVNFAQGDTRFTTVFGRTLSVLTIVGFGSIAIAAGIAIITRRLYDIDLVINKTVVFGALAAFITIVYVAVVVGLGAAIGNHGRPNLGLSVLATAIVALSVQPVRTSASRFANRFVFGERASPYEALSQFGERISTGISTDEVLPQLARLMTEATAATRASVWLAIGPSLVPAAAWPQDVGELAAVPAASVAIPGYDHLYPVRHHGEPLGALAIATSASEPLTPSQSKLITDLASQAALVMRNGRLIADLQASRQRLVATADQERRRIERNLHDGAQQHLVALSVKLSLVDRLMKADPAAATAMVAELRGDATEALENLRDLARGIYPPLLADQGLPAALGAQLRKAPVPVTFTADGVGRYAQEVESAIYFCVLEAVQNIGKYAGARSAGVTLGAEDGRVTFRVSDDGAGFDPASQPRGAGLTNMTDRVEALGGALDVRSQSGQGTTISGWVRAK